MINTTLAIYWLITALLINNTRNTSGLTKRDAMVLLSILLSGLWAINMV